MGDAMDFTWTDVDTTVQNEINKEFETYRNQQVINWDPSLNQSVNINTNSGKASFYEFFIVVDTNILLYRQKFLSDLFQFPREYQVAIVIPWIVIQELDGLKNSTKLMDDNISLSKLARSALSLILKYTVDENSNLIGQKYNEVLNVGNPMFSKNDDKILDCCLYFRQNYMKEVFLLSNDKALCVKSVFSNIKVIESWEDSAEAFIMHITSIDENKAQNVANSVTPFSSSSNYNTQNNNRFNINNNSNNNNFNSFNMSSINQSATNNNNNNGNMNTMFNFNRNVVSSPVNNASSSHNNSSDLGFKDYDFGKKNKPKRNFNNYGNFDFDFPLEGYSSANDHKKFMEEFEKSYQESRSSDNNSKFNFNYSRSNNNNNKNNNKTMNNNSSVDNKVKINQNNVNSKKKNNQNQNDLYDDLLNYSYSSVNDHKKLMEDYERSLREEEEELEKDNKSKNVGIKRKQEFDTFNKPSDSGSSNSNSPVLLNRKIINPTRRLKQRNLNNNKNNDINNKNNELQFLEKRSISSNSNYETKFKKMRTNIQSPLSNNTINSHNHSMTMNVHNNNSSKISSNYSTNRMNTLNIHTAPVNSISNSMVQSYNMAVETNNTSENCTLQMIKIVEHYLPNGLKKFVDSNMKKNKPIPNNIPYAFPTKVNDLFNLIINSWDFFKKGYPSFYGNEPLAKTIETKTLFEKYKIKSQELTEKELLKVHRNLEQILEICEGLEGREVSIKRRKDLKNIKDLIKNIK